MDLKFIMLLMRCDNCITITDTITSLDPLNANLGVAAIPAICYDFDPVINREIDLFQMHSNPALNHVYHTIDVWGENISGTPYNFAFQIVKILLDDANNELSREVVDEFAATSVNAYNNIPPPGNRYPVFHNVYGFKPTVPLPNSAFIIKSNLCKDEIRIGRNTTRPLLASNANTSAFRVIKGKGAINTAVDFTNNLQGGENNIQILGVQYGTHTDDYDLSEGWIEMRYEIHFINGDDYLFRSVEVIDYSAVGDPVYTSCKITL